jgi:hypothetical protein
MRKRTVWAGTEVECALAAVQHPRRAPQKGFDERRAQGTTVRCSASRMDPQSRRGARDHLPIGA